MDIAVLFADMRGSTGLGEQMEPGQFAALLNRFYRTTTDVLLAHEATIDKMVGDEVMALFIPGFCGPRYRQVALEAAEDLLAAMGYGEGSQPWVAVGVGVHAGPAFVGIIGSEGLTDFTALGDMVNTCARLQELAAGGEIVFSEAVYEAVAGRRPGVERRLVTLQGKKDPMPVRVLSPPHRQAAPASGARLAER